MTACRIVLAIIALALLPRVARAADLPVSYTVNEIDLRTAPLGTMLTFQLYADAACSGAAVHTETVAIENVDIISRLKLYAPRGATKPPKTDELRHTLTGVTPAASLYLTVSGVGVTPVAGACQAQPSAGGGSQGPAGPGVAVRDANEALVGIWSADPSCEGGNALRDIGGVLRPLIINNNTITGTQCLLYTEFFCAGTPYLPNNAPACMVQPTAVTGSTLYYPNGAPSLVTYRSRKCLGGSGACQELSTAQTVNAAPTTTTTLPAFALPFHLATQ